MGRKLKPCTIIPPELYVFRDADRQLRSVLKDMGRPGYILVARQMGKTNLLLNAKRELEDRDNAFIYIDLSAPFATERECFRHIIDTALDTRAEIFGNCKPAIYEARGASPLPSYKEHENELRTLLTALGGKLVIILDEIDSLTKGTFSDRIFAQIRSVYFTRANYPQFTRLTYVLSGVVEPNEIIKDKRISPFNIGEKIYLDDFTYEEYLDFISRADLKLSNEATERIYYWAGGNPRLTWDICYDMEEKLAAGYFPTSPEVDSSVKKLYLTDFTKAPIDHIREVVTTEDDLRSAITQIKYGKGDTLPDTIKNKLYLAGIIRSAANHKNVTIKNKIIEAALSDQWLLDVSLQKKGLAKLAAERFEEHDYTEALALYSRFLQSGEASSEKENGAYWHMALSAYHLGEYQAALTYLEKTHWDRDAAGVLYYERKFYLGASHLQLGNIDASRAQFEETLQAPKKNATYVTALINLGATYAAERNFTKAVDLYQQALASADSVPMGQEEHNRTKASALYNLAKMHAKMGDNAASKAHLGLALDAALPTQRPTIVLDLCDLVVGHEEKKRLIGECANLIIGNNLHPDASHPGGTLGLTPSVFFALLREAYSLDPAIFQRLFTFASNLKEIKDSKTPLLLRLAYITAGARNFEAAIRMTKDLMENRVSELPLNKDSEYEGYRLLCALCTGNQKEKYRGKYVEYLKSGYEPKTIEAFDIQVFTDIITDLIRAKKFSEALTYIAKAKQFKPLIPSDQIVEFTMIHFCEMLAYRAAGNLGKLRQASQDTLTFLESVAGRPPGTRLVDAEALKRIEELARNNLEFNADLFAEPITLRSQVVRPAPKRGRNDRVSVRYIDGTVKHSVKYKKVQSDLHEGRCTFL